MQPDDRFQVMNEDIELTMKEIADRMADALPDGWGFALQIFDFKETDEPGSLFYVSNAKRADMLNMLEDFIKRNKEGDPT